MCQKQQPRCCHCANPQLPTWTYCAGFRATAKFMTSAHGDGGMPDPLDCRNTGLSIEDVPMLYGCDAIDECVAWIAAVSPGLRDYETRALRAERRKVAGEFAERRREEFVGSYCSKVEVGGKKEKRDVKGFMKVAGEAHWNYMFGEKSEQEEERRRGRELNGQDSFMGRRMPGMRGARRPMRFNGPPLEQLVKQPRTPPPEQQAKQAKTPPSEQPSNPIPIPASSTTSSKPSRVFIPSSRPVTPSKPNPSSTSSSSTASTHLTIPLPNPRHTRTLSQPQLAPPRLTRGNPLLTLYSHGAPLAYDWITCAAICGPDEDAAAESLGRVLKPKRRRWSWSVGCCWKGSEEEEAVVEDEGDDWIDSYWIM